MTTNRTRTERQHPLASVIIPAYNEARVIGRCLRALLQHANPGEFDVVVVCNGCSDGTSAAARRADPAVRVFDIDQASKTVALNYGDQVAKTFPRVYLDADLEVSTDAVRSLLTALRTKGCHAAVGFMDVDLSGRPWIIRYFYKLWLLHPYLQRGKFGGIYALNRTGWQRRGLYPAVVADDTFVRERFQPAECAAVETCRFRVFPPRTLGDMVRIRSRAYLGNRQLRDHGAIERWRGRGDSSEWLRRVGRHPDTWPGLPVYLAVNLFAKLHAARLYRRARFEWLRDESSREVARTASAA